MGGHYHLDGLLILGIVLMTVTIASAVRGLYSRSVPLDRVASPRPKKPAAAPKKRHIV